MGWHFSIRKVTPDYGDRFTVMSTTSLRRTLYGEETAYYGEALTEPKPHFTDSKLHFTENKPQITEKLNGA